MSHGYESIDGKTRKFDVAVIGNVGIDTNVYQPGADIDFSVESNFTENIDYVGQAGGYTCRGYAQLGYRTAFIGYVGDDFSGRFIREELGRDGINLDALFIDPAGTSRSINFMYRDGRRKNFYDGKSHMLLSPDLDRCEAILRESALAHVHIPNWARRLLPIARRHGVKIACDIQDVVSIDDAYRRDFIEAADVLFFSAVNQAAPEPIIRSVLQMDDSKIIIAGMGAQGCAVGTRVGITYYQAVDLEAPVIDTNGAGDGLAVGFLASYFLDNYDLAAAIRRGQICARHTCTLKANSSGLLDQATLNRLFASRQKHLNF